MGKKWERKKRRARRKRLQHRILLAVARMILGPLSRLTPESASRLGDALGRVACRLAPGPRRLALFQLSRSLPGTNPRRTAVRVFRNLAANALEWNSWSSRGPGAAVLAVRSVTGFRHFEDAYEAGKGVIVVTGHFGLFELMPVWFIQRGLSGYVVGRRPSDTAFERFVVDRRSAMEVPTIPQTHARKILRVLRAGEIVGILPDQDIDKLPGLFVPFFGREAYTPTGPAAMAVATGAPIVPVFIYREGPGHHRLEFHPPVEDPGGTKEARIRAITESLTKVLEEVITADPEQWAWIHDRWATTPGSLARRRERRAAEAARRGRRRASQ